jgi:hypothetical protein
MKLIQAKRKVILIPINILFYLILSNIYAQDSTKSINEGSVVSLSKLSFGSFNGFEYEARLSKNSSLSFSAGVGVYYTKEDLVYNVKGSVELFPVVSYNYRYYYNIFKRTKSQKNYSDNAANYFFGRMDVVFPRSAGYTNNWLVSQGWGLQRQIVNKLYFNMQVGITENFFKDFNVLKIRFQPLLDISAYFKL